MSDPFFDDVVSLLHFDGVDGDTTTTDVIGTTTWTLADGADITDAFAKFGPTSCAWNSPSGDLFTTDLPHIGTQDFTIEGWVNVGDASPQYFFDFREVGSDADAMGVLNVGGGQLDIYIAVTLKYAGTIVAFNSTWNYVSVSRVAGVTYLHINGVLDGSFADTTNYQMGSTGFWWGQTAVPPNSTSCWGYMDDNRITIGTGRYAAGGYSVPTEAHPDAGPVLAPTIDTQPQPQTVTEGNNAVYTVAATTSGGTLLYQWYETTAGILGGETADTLTITTVLGDNGNGYYVIVTDDNGATQSDTAALTVNAVIPPPSGGSTIFDDSKGFPSEEYENAIDRITFMMQELEGSLCDCRDDPNVVVCVALLSSTGIYNTELQGGGEPTPIAGETLTLGVGVSGTGPYTYQWKVDAVDVVGATSMTFEYVVTGNASITVQVTNECSTILVGPYEIFICQGYDCDALAETGRVVADAYWPMTDPMALADPANQYYHAGATYGPYDDGLLNEWQLAVSQGVVDVNGPTTRTIAFDKFNYCETETASYQHNYLPTIGGSFQVWLHQNGAKYLPNAEGSYKVSHALREISVLRVLDLESPVIFHNDALNIHDAYGVSTWCTFAMDGTNATFSLNFPDGSAQNVVAHDFDITKPYVVTCELRSLITDGAGGAVGVGPEATENYIAVWELGQPGATSISLTQDETRITGNYNRHEQSTGGGHSLGLILPGGVYLMGVAYGGVVHARILDGLARNYEDYVCP